MFCKGMNLERLLETRRQIKQKILINADKIIQEIPYYELSKAEDIFNIHHGNTGCQVSKRGVQIYKYFCLNMYRHILGIQIVLRTQIVAVKIFK